MASNSAPPAAEARLAAPVSPTTLWRSRSPRALTASEPVNTAISEWEREQYLHLW